MRLEVEMLLVVRFQTRSQKAGRQRSCFFFLVLFLGELVSAGRFWTRGAPRCHALSRRGGEDGLLLPGRR